MSDLIEINSLSKAQRGDQPFVGLSNSPPPLEVQLLPHLEVMLGIVVELGDVVIDTEQLSNLLAGLDGDAKDEPPFVALEVKGQVACFESRIHVSFILASSPG
jgi:hypothetical protein